MSRSMKTGAQGGIRPLSDYDKAARLAVLAGGMDALYQRARAALYGGDAWWAAVLADHLLVLDHERLDYYLLKGDALRAMGDKVFSDAGAAASGLTSGFTQTAGQNVGQDTDRRSGLSAGR